MQGFKITPHCFSKRDVIFLVKAGGMRITSKPHPQHQLTPEQKAEDKKFMEEEQIAENLEEK